MTPREAAELFGDRLMFILCALVLTNLALMGMVGWFLFRQPLPRAIACTRALVRTGDLANPERDEWAAVWIEAKNHGESVTLHPDGSVSFRQAEWDPPSEGRQGGPSRTRFRDVLYPPLSVVHVEEVA